ncbi:MAG: tetratricopeptide repeat domain containing protein [Chlorobi bacterium]|nr:tetratricopeptide repeat domain containing protein [Chlorobiota bacterium]
MTPDPIANPSRPAASIAVASADVWARAPQVSLESERRAHETFGSTRRRAYVEIPHYLERLDAYAGEGGPPLVVTGDSGAGKSALLAYWSHRYRNAHHDAFVITHHVGAAASGGDHLALLRRIMMEIAERCDLHDPVPADGHEIERAFPLWLGQVQQEHLVIAIDALDQLDEPSQWLTWLPAYLPPRIRLILSTSGGPTLDDLRRRGLPQLEVLPLTMGERKEVIRRFLGDPARTFSSEQLRRVTVDSMSANPLFLRTRLEELRRYPADEQLNAKIDHYLEARDLDDLFQKVLARLEGEFDPDVVRRVMTPVWASRRGLHRDELATISGIGGDMLAALLKELEFHVMERDGMLSFFHDHLRDAVRNRYVSIDGGDGGNALHHMLAAYFAGTPWSPRRAEEEPWQFRQAEAWKELHGSITSLPMFLMLAREETMHQLMAYWIALGDRYDMVKSYMREIALHEHEPTADTAVALYALGRFFSECGEYAAAEGLCRRALELREQLPAEGHPPVTNILDTLAATLYHIGGNGEALELSGRALAERVRTLGEMHPAVARNLVDLGAILYATGDHAEAELLLTRALSLTDEAGRHELPVVAMILNNLGAIHLATERPHSATAYFQRALGMNERLLGPEHPEVASNLINIACALQSERAFDTAIEYFNRALSINGSVLGEHHPHIAFILTNLGWIMRETGDLPTAESYLRRALDIRREGLGPDNAETFRSAFRLGRVLAMSGRPGEAAALYHEAIDGLARLLGADHPDLLNMRRLAAGILPDDPSD